MLKKLKFSALLFMFAFAAIPDGNTCSLSCPGQVIASCNGCEQINSSTIRCATGLKTCQDVAQDQ